MKPETLHEQQTREARDMSFASLLEENADLKKKLLEKPKNVIIIKRNRLVFLIGYATGFATGITLLFFIIRMLEVLL